MGHRGLLGGIILLLFLDQVMLVFPVIIHHSICLICRCDCSVLTVSLIQPQMNWEESQWETVWTRLPCGRSVKDVRRSSLEVGSALPWLGALDGLRIERADKHLVFAHSFLSPDCGCDVTSCFKFLPPSISLKKMDCNQNCELKQPLCPVGFLLSGCFNTASWWCWTAGVYFLLTFFWGGHRCSSSLSHIVQLSPDFHRVSTPGAH